MNKIKTLNKNQDFKRAYLKGRYCASPLMVTYVLKNKRGINRFGITTSKKIGNAVMRNRARRVLRVSCFSLCDKVKEGFDIVFVARKDTPFTKSYNVLKDMSFHLKKLGVLK